MYMYDKTTTIYDKYLIISLKLANHTCA